MDITRNIIRFMVALIIAPVVWIIATPYFIFLDFLYGDDMSTTKVILAGHWAWLTFKG